MRHSLKRLARWVGTDGLVLVLLAGGLVAIALPQATPIVVEPWGTCTYDMRSVVGSPCWDPETPAILDAQSALDEAAQIVEVSAGLDCRDPSTGQVGTHLVVRDAETGEITLIPFDAAAIDQAAAGAFWTLKACTG